MKTRHYGLLIIAMLLIFSPIATANNDSWLTRYEKSLGQSAAQQLVNRYGGKYQIPFHQAERVDEVFRRLVAVANRTELDYTLTPVNSRQINAFALPGGYVFITRGLLDEIGNDEHMLAAVLGHEIAHIEKKHGVNALLRQMGLTIVMEVGIIWMDLMSSEAVRMASLTLLDLVQAGYGREAEFEADQVGQLLAVEAGFDPAGAVRLLDLLLELEREERGTDIFSTHPPSRERRNRLNHELLSFWSTPKRISEELELAGQTQDPQGRYDLRPSPQGLIGFDNQLQREVNWLSDYPVKDYAWSPSGNLLAVSVRPGEHWELWLLNRLGNTVTVWRSDSEVNFSAPSWCSTGERIAFRREIKGNSQIVVGYLEGSSEVLVSRNLQAELPYWLPGELVFTTIDGQVYSVMPPKLIPLVVSNPIPRILQRRPGIEPELIKEDGGFTLRRPTIWQPDSRER